MIFIEKNYLICKFLMKLIIFLNYLKEIFLFQEAFNLEKFMPYFFLFSMNFQKLRNFIAV